MQLGIFSKHFQRPTLGGALDAVRDHGLTCVQFNFESCGSVSMPDSIATDLCESIQRELATREIAMTAVSGTFNMIHPDEEERRRGLHRLDELIGACSALGTSVITLCSGTRDPENMWGAHPDNATPEAWRDLVASLSAALPAAEEKGVVLAFEPEVANVIDSAPKARSLLDEIGSPNLKVVMDGANIFHEGELPRMTEMLEEAFELLGSDLAFAHAKDLDHDGEAGNLAAGSGMLDYDLYLSLLKQEGQVPLIFHGLEESQVSDSVAFVRAKL